ncbi:prepilin peptidase [Cupriavidus basilensis]|uniref:Prepilin peptidase n=1 Tax=Cupriavidus basilensis TaxID=68895 RepID=A0ABT6ARV9_9BURK|nr:prepilin peptidase [Cupriavidus basilensis]MDF3835123.1 prepilin peptidase [Cupriavidus basilensis]
MASELALPPLIGPCAIVLVLAAAALDLKSRRIPNWLTLGAWVLALPLQMTLHGPAHGALGWTSGWLTGFACFLPFYLLRGMAAGDVKLMAAVGALLGAGMAFEVALLTFVLGGVWALAMTIRRGRLARLRGNLQFMLFNRGRMDGEQEVDANDGPSAWSVGTLPYGAAIAAGTIGVLFASV